MSDVRNKISMFLLLLLVSLTATAEDSSMQQGCRRGTPRTITRGIAEERLPGGDFYKGDLHQLVVMVAFEGRDFKGNETATLELWDKIFNQKNFKEGNFYGSVHDYFCDQSYDQFRPVFDLVYLKVGNPKKYASTAADDENSQYLVEDVVDKLKTFNIDWGKYDWNGDGYVNQLLIVYAGHGMHDSSGSDLIWPHQWWMSEHLKDRQQGVYCNPIPVSSGNKDYLIDCYCALNELTRNNDYGSFGTICHEYSHCFGFPDFYYGRSAFVYGWDLMDAGNYNGDGYQPAGYSAHERWLMGWLTPVELDEATTITDMPALADRDCAYLIRNEGYKNEYYFVENRQPVGWDACLPGSGILIFHIDFDPTVWTSTQVGANNNARQHYVLFHANNSSSYGRWAYPYGSNNSLTNTSTPAATLWHDNSDGTRLMNKSLYDMTVEGGLVSFRFEAAPPTGIAERPSSQTSTILYDLGPLYIIRCANGEIKKVMKH